MASCRWISSRVVAIVNNPTHCAVTMINTAVAVLFTAILVATRSPICWGRNAACHLLGRCRTPGASGVIKATFRAICVAVACLEGQ